MALREGRRYSFGIAEGEVVRHWWYGRREDLLTTSRETAALMESSGEPIALHGGQAVEFETASATLDPKTLDIA